MYNALKTPKKIKDYMKFGRLSPLEVRIDFGNNITISDF